MEYVKMNASEIKDMLAYMYENNCKNQEEFGITPISVSITGDAGLGKTSIIEQFAQEHDLQFVKLNLSMLDELSD